MRAARRLWQGLQQTRPWRAWSCYGQARGNILAAGVAYFAFFSVFPAVALAFAVLGFVATGHPALVQDLVQALDRALPGFIRTAGHPDGVIAVSMPSTTALTWTGIIAVVTLLLAGAGWLGALRSGIRAVLRVEGEPGNAVTAKLRDLGVLGLLGVLLLLSTAASSGLTAASEWVAGLIGVGVPAGLVTGLGLLGGLLGDVVLMVVLLRLLSGVPLPWRDIRSAALLGGAALAVMMYFGGQLVSLGVRNPAFGAVIGIVGLLFWLNLIARVVLLAAAWAAPDVAHPPSPEPAAPGEESTPAQGPASGAPGSGSAGRSNG